MEIPKRIVVITILMIVTTTLAGTAVIDQTTDFVENCDEEYGEDEWEVVSSGETAGLSPDYECVPKGDGEQTSLSD